jgi:hypothetical protein
MWVLLRPHDSEEPIMQVITTIGLDIAKSVFQIHGVDAGGQVVMRRQLKRRYVLTFFENRRPRCRRGMVKRRFINPDTLTKSPNYPMWSR